MPYNRDNPEDLKDAFRHVNYGLQMLKKTSDSLTSNEELSWEVNNALVESFVIHARSLIDFLFRERIERTWDDDVLAHDYLDVQDWNLIASEGRPEYLDKVFKRAHKEVAHITAFRLRKLLHEEEFRWKTKEITLEIFQIFNSFFEYVDYTKIPEGSRDNFNNLFSDLKQKFTDTSPDASTAGMST